MRILQIISGFHPAYAYGGTVKVAYGLSKRLVKRGHDVTVYSSDSFDCSHRIPCAVSDVEGIRVFYFRNLSNTLAWKYRLFVTPGMLPRMRMEMAEYDVVHIHDFYTFQNIITHHYAVKTNVPYVVQAHGSLIPDSGRKNAKMIFNQTIGKRILQDATQAIALTETEARRYRLLGMDEQKVVVVPTPVDLQEYRSTPARGLFKKRFSLDEERRIVLYVGRIHQSKGLELLVEAFASAVRKMDNLTLVLVGADDGWKPRLDRMIQELGIGKYVLFTGFVSDDATREAYVDAEVFVTPKYSGFPSTFLEACASGTPIVTTTAGDRLDWLDGRAGYTVNPDARQLENALLRIIGNNELRTSLGMGGKDLVNKEFSWDSVLDRIEEVYRRATEQ